MFEYTLSYVNTKSIQVENRWREHAVADTFHHRIAKRHADYNELWHSESHPGHGRTHGHTGHANKIETPEPETGGSSGGLPGYAIALVTVGGVIFLLTSVILGVLIYVRLIKIPCWKYD
ncbi:uncharacterized protein [Ptychodera flava]|uniref:uncharacterized protein isoform X2 n=1 Tax=Ptychodera flava TaxID=63121 RepID=UPI00396A226B